MTVSQEKILPEYLPEEELLSEFIAPEDARQLLREYSSIYNILLHTPESQLINAVGLSKRKMKTLASLGAIIRKVEEGRRKVLKTIREPKEAAAYCSDLQALQQEEVRVLFLNTKNRVLGQKTVFLGTVNSAPVSAREIFYAAVKYMAASVILLHNHPSGEPSPSREDEEITKRLVQAGEILDIKVIDHVIIGRYGYYSFKEKGYLEVS